MSGVKLALLLIFGILAMILLLPVGVRAAYREDGPLVQVLIGSFRFQLFPARRKKKKPEIKKKKKQKKEKDEESRGGDLSRFKPLLRVFFDEMKQFQNTVVITHLTIHVTFGAENAAKAALCYGRAWAVIGALTPLIESKFRVRERDLQAILDYEEKSLKIYVDASFRMFVWQLAWLGVKYGCKLLGILIKTRKTSKSATDAADQ